MKWFSPLYLGESIGTGAGRYCAGIESGSAGPWDRSILIVLSAHQGASLELITVRLAMDSRNLRREDLRAVGLAGSLKEARELTAQIALECLEATGGEDLKEWFLSFPQERWSDRGEVGVSKP